MSIETVTEISTEVLKIVINEDFSVTDVMSYMNKGLKEIAGTVLLPKLLETDIVIDTVVDTAYASMPDTFMRSLHYCYSEDRYRQIKIYDDVRLLYRKFSQLDLGGSVVGVARGGDRLYYQRIPASAETLRIHFYKYPTILTAVDDSPDCLPEFLVRPLMVSYVAKEMFSLVEMGMVGPKVDTGYHELKFAQAMAGLRAYVGPEQREPQYIEDDVGIEGYL